MCRAIAWVTVAMVALPALGAPRGRSDGHYTILGRMDSPRYLALGAFKALEDIQKADVLWNKREYELAQAAYEKFVATYAGAKEDANRAVLPYATLMQGVCLQKLKKHEQALAKFAEVIKQWPESEDATIATYRSGVSHREEGRDDPAAAAFGAVFAKADKIADRDLLYDTCRWLFDYHGLRRRLSKESEAQWLAAGRAMLKINPDQRAGSRVLEDLLDFFKAQRDWAGYRAIAAIRRTEAEAETFAIDAIMRSTSLDIEAARDSTESLKAMRPALEAMVKDLVPRVQALKASAGAGYADLVLRLIGFCCQAGLPDGNAIMTQWMAEHPDDRMALYAYGGYVRQGGFDPSTFDKVFMEYLKKHPKDAGVRDLYARVVRDLANDAAKAAEALKQYGAGDWDMAEFCRPIDPKRAAQHYADASNDPKQSAERRSEAAFLAAEMYRQCKQYQDAIAFYIRTEQSHPQSLEALGDCYYETGQWKQAVEAWRKVADDRRSKGAAFEANLKIVNALLEHKDPEGPKALEALARLVGRGRGSDRVYELAKRYNLALPEPRK